MTTASGRPPRQRFCRSCKTVRKTAHFELEAGGHIGRLYRLTLRQIGQLVTVILLCLGCLLPAPRSLYAQTPSLVVSAGTQNLAPTLTVTSDSAMPWKAFTVSGGSGNYGVIWAESNGTTGGIYFGNIVTSSSGPAALPGPTPPPAPSDLPIAALSTAVSAAVSTVDPTVAGTMAVTYEGLAKSIDTGVISSPLQLQVVTGTQLLTNFTSDQLAAAKPLTAAVRRLGSMRSNARAS